MRILRDAYFVAVAANHLAVDVLNTQMSLLVVFLAPSLKLSNADIGLVLLVYMGFGSLTQPVFGWLADRYKIRWISGSSLLWQAGWLSAAVLLPDRWVIPAIAIAALGTAGFHATGYERATARGDHLMIGRAASSASVFIFFGMIGHAVGPVMGGNLLESMGRRGILLITAVTIPVALNSLYRMCFAGDVARPGRALTKSHLSEPGNGFRRGKLVLIAFCLMVACYATAGSVSMTFIPKLFQDRGYTPSAYGMMATVYLGGMAIGGLTGGFLADRWGRRRVVLFSLLAAVLPMYYYPVMAGPAMYAAVFLAGSFNGASLPVIIVLVQGLLPRRRGLATGLTLGFMFASGSVGAYIFGLAADVYPLADVMQVNGVLCLLAAFLSSSLRRDSSTRKVAAQSQLMEAM